MAIKSSYGFARSSGSGGGTGGVTNILRRYDLAIKNAEQLSPDARLDALRNARETLLDPYSDNLQVQMKIADSQNKEANLSSSINQSKTAAYVIQDDLNSALKTIGKQLYTNPDALIQDFVYEHTLAVDRISQAIDEKKANAEPYQDYLKMYEEVKAKEGRLLNLYREKTLNPTGLANKNAYGFSITTDINGNLIDIDVDETNKLDNTDKFRTSSRYGGLQVYVNGQPDPKDPTKTVALIGNNAFGLTEKDTEDGKVKVMQLRKQGNFDKSEKDDVELSFTDTFGNPTLNVSGQLRLPTGSIVKRGVPGHETLYLFGKDGPYRVDDKNALEEITGKRVDIDSIPSISKDELESLGSFTDDPAKPRVISAQTAGSLKFQQVGQDTMSLPSLDQKVSGTIPSSDALSRSSGESTPAIVPRKTPVQKTAREYTTGGYSGKDIIAKTGESLQLNNGGEIDNNLFSVR